MKELGIYHPVGSHYIVPKEYWVVDEYHPKDIDFLVYVQPARLSEYEAWLESEGWKLDVGESYAELDSKFKSWKKAAELLPINFIVTTDSDFFEKFLLAAKMCKELVCASKEKRILIHNAILKGTFYDESPLKSKDYGCETFS